MIIARGKRSAALGCGPEMISSLFSISGLARHRRARPEMEKRGVGWGGSLPRAAASAALPWAIIRPPRWGFGEANHSWQPTPGLRVGCFRLPSVRRGCTFR
jgi:hypothetical protein